MNNSDRKHSKEILPTDLYREILRVCFRSEKMAAYLEDHPVSKYTAIEIVLKAPVGLEEKAMLLDKIALTDKSSPDTSETPVNEEKQISAFLRRKLLIERRTAKEHADAIRRALDALKLKPGEILCKREHWFDEDIMEEKYGYGVLFQTMEAAADYMRRELEYELDGEEPDDDVCPGWTELEKWAPGENGMMENPYTFYLFYDKIVYFTENRHLYDDLYRLPESRVYAGGDLDLNLPIPFQPGDIVTLDCRPFSPPKPVVLLEVGDDCCGVQMLCRGVDGLWYTAALKHRCGWIDKHYMNHSILSPLYRLTSYSDDLAPEDEKLKKVSDCVGGNAQKGRALWDAIHNSPSVRERGMLTDTELLSLLSGSIGRKEKP
ncbi:MAG: hypothetical protein IK118_00635 [Clostridia bacterium]|nr:hypothetical protein [Clostridia bacterium]